MMRILFLLVSEEVVFFFCFDAPPFCARRKGRTEEHGFALTSDSVTLPLSTCVLPRWGSTYKSKCSLFATSRYFVITCERTLASKENVLEKLGLGGITDYYCK
jgi:hypothetical protein